MALVVLGNKATRSLVDKGCRRTQVQQTPGPWSWQILRTKCIHGDVREYRTKVVALLLPGKCYHCQAVIVSQLDWPVLLGKLLNVKAVERFMQGHPAPLEVWESNVRSWMAYSRPT